MSSDGVAPAKVRKIDDSEDADDSMYDSETQKALEDIDACQNEIDTLNEKASEEILQTEQKYNKLRKPYFNKRNSIAEKIPSFWVTAFVNHPQISAILEEDEEECLQALHSVNIEEFDDIKSGYKISFTFLENAYFTNKELVKEFNLGTSGDPTSTSTEIAWREGKDLVKKATEQQDQGKGKRKLVLDRTFFQWFGDNSDPANDDIAEVLKDDMWPNPLQYFLATDINGVDSEDEDDDNLDESEEIVGEEEEEDEEGDEEGEEDLGDIEEDEEDDA